MLALIDLADERRVESRTEAATGEVREIAPLYDDLDFGRGAVAGVNSKALT
jgi:hypothetical protein